jgi:hypothetical protein
MNTQPSQDRHLPDGINSLTKITTIYYDQEHDDLRAAKIRSQQQREIEQKKA